MRKLVVCLAVMALAVLFTSPAVADNGLVSSSQLQAMGLAGMHVMSDAEAMSVRGKMHHGHGMPQPWGGHGNHGKKHKKPWILAAGGSVAGVLGGEETKNGENDYLVGSAQIAVADGKYFASVATSADFELSTTDKFEVAGPGQGAPILFSVTKTHTLSGATSGTAGGFAF